MNETSLLGRIRQGLGRILLSAGHIWLPFVLILPFLFFVYLRMTNGQYSRPADPQGGFGPYTAWAGTPVDYVSWIWIAMVSSVMFFGALGSTVSFFSRQTLGAAIIDEKRSLISAQLFGAVFAIILTLTFLGGLVQGSLFPAMAAESWSNFDLRIDDWTKLLVWAFIAGFSERFVPDLLNNFVVRGRGDEEPERPRKSG